MRILRYVYEYPPPWDGLTSGPFELSQAQASLGHQVSMVCGGFPTQRTYHVDSINVRRLLRAIPVFDLSATTSPAVLMHYLWATLNRSFDLVHSHNHIGLWVHFLRRYFKGARTLPFILHLHITAAGRRDTMVRGQQAPGLATRRIGWPIHVLSDKIGCRIADAIVCTSEAVRQEAIRFYGADPDRATVVPNGVNTELFRAEGPNFRAQAGLSPGDAILLFVGAVSQRKNVASVIQALSLLPEKYKLVIVGRNDSEYAHGLRRQVRSQGLATRVRFEGYIPYSDLPPFYRGADLLLLPSYYEGFPKVVVESLACGTPVLTSQRYGDPVLAPLVDVLSENTAECLAQRSRAIVESGRRVDPRPLINWYGWDAIARRLDRVYEQAVANRAARVT